MSPSAPAGQGLGWLREAAIASKLFGGSPGSLSGISLSSSSQNQQQQQQHQKQNQSQNSRQREDTDDDGTHYMPMAVRNNELFVVVDNTIRWADLTRMKATWEEEEQNQKSRKGAASGSGSDGRSGSYYKTLKLKLHERIRQLIISPNEELMAVVTEHNVVVVVLPEPSSLRTSILGDSGKKMGAVEAADAGDAEAPVRVKTHTIGPTTHVTSQSAVIRALWHPLGVDGNCLVTVTASAVVRVWELDRRTLSSFSEPTLALDLKKLRHARSQEQHVGAGDMTANRTFSTDDVEMEVTAACFGLASATTAQAFEWSAATLWVAMAEGDVFALCPLLPSRFQPDDDGNIPPLLELKLAQKQLLDAAAAGNGDDNAASPIAERARVQAQCAWLTELKEQYDEYDNFDGFASGPAPQRVYTRPKSQGTAPRLQGPFVIVPNDVQDDLTPCDLHVIGATAAAGLANTFGTGTSSGDGTYADTGDLGTSFSTICILSTDGRVHICIDVDGVEPQWLPRRRTAAFKLDGQESGNDAELLLFEALDTLRLEDAEFGRLPTFTPSTDGDEYKFYVTHSRGVYEFSLEPWIFDLEAEIQNSGTEGVRFRTQVLSRGPGTSRQRILRVDQPVAAGTPSTASLVNIATPVMFGTEELGRMLLTVQGERPQAILFQGPDVDEEPAELAWKPGTDLRGPTGSTATGRGHFSHASYDAAAAAAQQRDIYIPAPAFSARTELSNFVTTQTQEDPRQQRLLREEIRLSPATLTVMTDAHRVLSRETAQLNLAASELFRRCERLHDEFRHQLQRAAELAGRVREFNDQEGDDGDDSGGTAATGGAKPRRRETVQRRLQEARERNERLQSRYEEVKRRLANAGGRPLSGKERAWVAEVGKVQAAAGDDGGDEEGEAETLQVMTMSTSTGSSVAGSRKMLLRRYEEVQSIAHSLLDQVREQQEQQKTQREEACDDDDGSASKMSSTAAGAGKSKNSKPGSGGGGGGGGSGVPSGIRRQRVEAVQEMLDRETALVDAAMEKLARFGLVSHG